MKWYCHWLSICPSGVYVFCLVLEWCHCVHSLERRMHWALLMSSDLLNSWFPAISDWMAILNPKSWTEIEILEDALMSNCLSAPCSRDFCVFFKLVLISMIFPGTLWCQIVPSGCSAVAANSPLVGSVGSSNRTAFRALVGSGQRASQESVECYSNSQQVHWERRPNSPTVWECCPN